MNMAEYQRQLVWNPGNAAEDKLLYCLLGLSGECGEVMELVKKRYRDWGLWNNAVVSLADDADFIAELGDVLWYLTKVCELSGTSLASVAQANLDKLAVRAKIRRRDASISLPGVDSARPQRGSRDDDPISDTCDAPDGLLRRSLGMGYRPPGVPGFETGPCHT